MTYPRSPSPLRLAIAPGAIAVAVLVAPSCSPGAPRDGDADPVKDASVDRSAGARVRVYQTSAAGDHLADTGTLEAHPAARPTRTLIAIDAGHPRQRITGFGGALTESAASALATLSPAARSAVIDAYFSSAGSGYTLARVPIASCDFSLAPYQYSTTADPALADFSIDHDRALLLPLIKAALASSAGELKILASPWSAPAWMKSPPELFIKPSAANGYQGRDPALRTDAYETYALYLSKYIQAYRREGVPIWAITPQNEPLGNGGNWETMSWSAASMLSFIRDDLGPRLDADGLDVKVIIYDHNKGPIDGDMVLWARQILADPRAAAYVWGTGAHWYGSTSQVFEASLDAVHALAPDKTLLATEATVDGLTDVQAAPPSAAYRYSWMSDAFYWSVDAYDWGYWWAPESDRPLHPAYAPVARYARDIIVGLNHWYTGWIDWNVALDRNGGPNHEQNWCAAGVMIDADAQTAYFTPLFYVMQHFSKFIRPGSTILPSAVSLAAGIARGSTDGLLAVAALGADGTVTTVVYNPTESSIEYSVVLDDQQVDGAIPAMALQTLVGLPLLAR
jgi:glucosylceramidase